MISLAFLLMLRFPSQNFWFNCYYFFDFKAFNLFFLGKYFFVVKSSDISETSLTSFGSRISNVSKNTCGRRSSFFWLRGVFHYFVRWSFVVLSFRRTRKMRGEEKKSSANDTLLFITMSWNPFLKNISPVSVKI